MMRGVHSIKMSQASWYSMMPLNTSLWKIGMISQPCELLANLIIRKRSVSMYVIQAAPLTKNIYVKKKPKTLCE